MIRTETRSTQDKLPLRLSEYLTLITVAFFMWSSIRTSRGQVSLHDVTVSPFANFLEVTVFPFLSFFDRVLTFVQNPICCHLSP